MYKHEQALLKAGYSYIAGCDEVGRGPMAGPLVCAAVILNPAYRIDGLNDSKKLSQTRRAFLYEQIKTHAIAYRVVFIDHAVVDEMNIYKATQLGLLKAITELNHRVDYALIDAMPIPKLDIPKESIIKGDQKSASIAAASILAKVERDQYMGLMASKYPGYGFERNKGYPTKEHKAALIKLGACEIHRKSYRPVADVLKKQLQLEV